MEHRFGNRRVVRAPVMLQARAQAPVVAHTREVSLSGMFVETAPAVFAANSVIDVELTLPGATGLRTYHWQAMVVRTTESGVGLMFDRLRPPAIMRLLAILDAGLSHLPGSDAVNIASAGSRPRLPV
jgi:hypothetical protein